MEPDCPQLAEVTNSGWTNGYIMKKWLETVFDPYTRDVPPGKRRLLIMDGHNTHVQVDFLDSCWSRAINCLILPSNMTSIFQPLDVAFFNQLKSAYHSKVHSHLLFSKATSLARGLFWKWHQQAWKETAVSRNICWKAQISSRRVRSFPLNNPVIFARSSSSMHHMKPQQYRQRDEYDLHLPD